MDGTGNSNTLRPVTAAPAQGAGALRNTSAAPISRHSTASTTHLCSERSPLVSLDVVPWSSHLDSFLTSPFKLVSAWVWGSTASQGDSLSPIFLTCRQVMPSSSHSTQSPEDLQVSICLEERLDRLCEQHLPRETDVSPRLSWAPFLCLPSLIQCVPTGSHSGLLPTAELSPGSPPPLFPIKVALTVSHKPCWIRAILIWDKIKTEITLQKPSQGDCFSPWNERFLES